jgi:hypothetical protein
MGMFTQLERLTMRVSMRDLDNVLEGIVAWLPPANRVETLTVCTNVDWLNAPGLGHELDKMKCIALLAKLKLLSHMVSRTLTQVLLSHGGDDVVRLDVCRVLLLSKQPIPNKSG